jgi:hypothetical protein
MCNIDILIRVYQTHGKSTTASRKAFVDVTMMEGAQSHFHFLYWRNLWKQQNQETEKKAGRQIDQESMRHNPIQRANSPSP